MRTQYAVLPAEHPQATAGQLERAIAAIEGGTQPEAASAVLRSMMADEDEKLYLVRVAARMAHVCHVAGVAVACAWQDTQYVADST